MTSTAYDEVIREFFPDEQSAPFEALTPDSLTRGGILATAFQRARDNLDRRRSDFLFDFGFAEGGGVDRQAQFGTYQNALRDAGRQLDSFEDLDYSRGFEGGSGLARSGAEFAHKFANASIDQMLGQFNRQLGDIDNERVILGEQFRNDLIQLKQDDRAYKVETEQFSETPARPETKETIAESNATRQKNADPAAAAAFALKRLRTAKKLGIKVGAIPKKEAELAAKWRRVSSRLSADQLAQIRKAM